MKLGTVVTASDLNPTYSEYIPAFIETWTSLVPEADIRIILVADAIPEALLPYSKHIHLMHPLPGVSSAFQAQCIRLLYPRSITRDEGVITDMDMLPLCRRYYVDSIKDVSDDAFVIYRDGVLHNQIPMCYCVAHPSTWQSIFGAVHAEELIQSWWKPDYTGIPGQKGWFTDQIFLYNSVMSWPGRIVRFKDYQLRFRRLDRSQRLMANIERACADIRSGLYVDYHGLRPYNAHRAINDAVVAAVKAQHGV
jgi:hypothetical protein